jgi:hypothetical protein
MGQSGNNITFKWLVGILICLLMGTAGFALASISSRAEDAHKRINALQEKKIDVDRYTCDMARIEKKLDILIERQGKK